MASSVTESTPGDVSIRISRSTATTADNKTGSWRFFRPRYEERTAPCSAACPAGEDIGRIQMMAGRRLFTAAGRIALLENPFPAVCGRVCFHPCETACNRAGFDDAVAVHQVERHIGDRLLETATGPPVEPRPPTGRRVAVIGAGPAGLAAAYFLTLMGHACEVFEAAAEPGGILRWGIPAYRLPAAVLAAEVARIEALGVDIRCRSRLRADFIEAAGDRYDGVFIGCGHGRRIGLNIAGEALALDGLELLRQVRQGRAPAVKGRAAVIGGGNTAIDVARTLVRLGAEVVIFYRRRRQDMPAFRNEVNMALAEGVRLEELAAPVGIRSAAADGSGLRELGLQRMTAGGTEPDGRCRAVPVDAPPEKWAFSQVVMAIGADADPQWHPAGDTRGGGLVLSHCSLQLDPLPVVAGGDLTSPVKSVADAVASGKQAALSLDAFFSHGREGILPRLEACQVGPGPALSMEAYLEGPRCGRSPRLVSGGDINLDYFTPAARRVPTDVAPSERITNFDPVTRGLPPADTVLEAGRCFNCGICNGCDNCRIFCPEVAVSVRGRDRRIELDYCKGCGICVTECPRRAMVMEQEAS
jgi:NADPH-dependent glutamate synthase beta subunit-like oxidoreductase